MTAALRPFMIATLLASMAALPAFAQQRDGLARVSVIHASPDAPAVDVLVNDEFAAFTGLQFGDVTRYADVPANAYDVKVVPAGAGPAAAVIQADLNLFYNSTYTVVAVDVLDDIRAIVLEDDTDRPARTESRLRFLHAAPDAPAVDVKVVDGPFLFQGIAFEELGESVTIPSNLYALEVRIAGTESVVLELDNAAFVGGGVYTLVATGLVADDSLDVLVARDSARGADAVDLPRPVARPLAGLQLSSADSLEN